jgi:hypothetical protein
MRLTRRQMLAAAAAMGAAGVVGVGAAWWDRPPAAGYRHLSAEEGAFLDAIAAAVFPAGGEPGLGGREAGVGRFLDEVWSGLEPAQRRLIRLSFHALDALPRATHLAPFRDLDDAEARETLRGWLDHPVAELRGLVTSLHMFAALAWTTHPQVAPHYAAQFPCGFGR